MKVSEYIRLLNELPDQNAEIVMCLDDDWWDITSIEYDLEFNHILLKSEDLAAPSDDEEEEEEDDTPWETPEFGEGDFEDDSVMPYGDMPNLPSEGTLKVM